MSFATGHGSTAQESKSEVRKCLCGRGQIWLLACQLEYLVGVFKTGTANWCSREAAEASA